MASSDAALTEGSQEARSALERLKDVDPVVATLVVCFALSSWIDMNGVWVELPILVHTLPEGWSLPSYIIVIIECAMITPFLYALINKFCPGNIAHREVIMAYVIMSVGLVSLVFLTFFWDYTAHVAGEERSMAVLVLIFSLAMVDTTSCVVYLPYMARFKEHYIPAYIAGEEMSGFITGLVGLIQGAGGDAVCSYETKFFMNETSGMNYTETMVSAVPNSPRFSVSVFFVFLSLVMVLSIVSFSLLN